MKNTRVMPIVIGYAPFLEESDYFLRVLFSGSDGDRLCYLVIEKVRRSVSGDASRAQHLIIRPTNHLNAGRRLNDDLII